MEFPFEKGSTEAEALARWLEHKIYIRQLALENSDTKEDIFRVQGQLKQCREILVECRIGELQRALAAAEENDKDDRTPLELETQPIPV